MLVGQDADPHAPQDRAQGVSGAALRTLIGPTIINSFRRDAFGNSVTLGAPT